MKLLRAAVWLLTATSSLHAQEGHVLPDRPVTAIEQDIVARLSALGYAEDVARAVPHGDKRNFDEIANEGLKAAA